MPRYEATTALPYPHYRDRAVAGLRAQLRHRMPRGEVANWNTFTVTGPVETADARVHIWYAWRAELATVED